MTSYSPPEDFVQVDGEWAWWLDSQLDNDGTDLGEPLTTTSEEPAVGGIQTSGGMFSNIPPTCSNCSRAAHLGFPTCCRYCPQTGSHSHQCDRQRMRPWLLSTAVQTDGAIVESTEEHPAADQADPAIGVSKEHPAVGGRPKDPAAENQVEAHQSTAADQADPAVGGRPMGPETGCDEFSELEQLPSCDAFKKHRQQNDSEPSAGVVIPHHNRMPGW